ncbi:MAG TPA: 50S ribosomal protein L17 [Blastocatellia bacterium]|nr:50S ribosomal protein L17 [Blastocatellia bacterium]
MRHLVAHRKLGRTSSHRKALLRNLCTSFVLHERIITTLPKAKELRPFAEKAVTLGRRARVAREAGEKEAALHATRQAAAFFFSGNAGPESKKHTQRNKPAAEATAGVAALKKLTGELAERFAERPGGYTRIFKLGPRKGDGAEMALIEFVGSEEKKAVEDKEEKKAGKKK